MAISIIPIKKQQLTALPPAVGLPSDPIRLQQSLQSDLTGGESVKIIYSLAHSHNVAFQTTDGPAKQIEVEADIPTAAIQRTDTVQLVEIGGGTGIAQVTIKQLIEAENNVHSSVVIGIQQ
jgi:hypothetical protein